MNDPNSMPTEIRSLSSPPAAPGEQCEQVEGAECRAESPAGFVCTLSIEHKGEHFAFQDDGGECDRWAP